MKAVQLNSDKKVVVNEIDIPETPEDRILVEVFAAGINPYDIYVSKGSMPIPLPFTLGGDFAGIVREVGEKVAHFIEGDGVYGNAIVFSQGSGSFAQYALVNPTQVAAKPMNVDFLKTGAMPLAGVSAIQGLMELLDVSPNQKILIHGGAGGIGTAAIQLAKHLGAYVATTVGHQSIGYVKQLGADEVIDYQNQKFEDKIKDFDAVFDLVGGETYNRSFPVLKKGGLIVSMKEEPDQTLMKKYGVNAIAQMTMITTERLTLLADLIDEGIMEIHIDKTFPLEEAASALAYLENEHPQGKVVLKMK